MKPPLVLADEPTGNLDTSSARRRLRSRCALEFREHGTAVLIVTHNRELAAQCPRLVEIVDGRITSDRVLGAAG